GVERGLQSSCYRFGGVHAPKRERAMVCGRNLALTIAVLLAPALAVAQAPPATKGPVAPMTEQLDPRACAHSDTPTTMGKASEIDPQQHEAAGNLSDKLARSAGVICPPQHIDPEIRQPTPPGGPMPVIPPPGNPGGDQSVQPKCRAERAEIPIGSGNVQEADVTGRYEGSESHRRIRDCLRGWHACQCGRNYAGLPQIRG